MTSMNSLWMCSVSRAIGVTGSGKLNLYSALAKPGTKAATAKRHFNSLLKGASCSAPQLHFCKTQFPILFPPPCENQPSDSESTASN